MGHTAAPAADRRLDRVVAAFAAFVLVEMTLWMVVILWAFERGGARLAAVATVLQLVPATVLSPFVAGYADRGDRGRALLLAHAGNALLVAAAAAALLADAGPVAVIGSSSAATVLIAVVRPAHHSLLPRLAGGAGALVRANAQSSGAESLAIFSGPVLAGLGVSTLGAGPTTALCAAVAALASALCLGLRVGPRDPRAVEAASSRLREATEGLRTVARDPAALALLLVLSTRYVLAGAFDILGTAYATQVLRLDGWAAGVVVGSGGLGMVLGSVVATRTSRRRRLGPVVVAGCAVQGAAVAAVAATGALLPAVLAMVVCGVGMTVMLVAGRTLLQRSTDDVVLARVFAVQESASLAGLTLGVLLAPVLIALAGPSGAFVPLGVGCVLGGLLCRRAVRQLDDRSVVSLPQLDLLRGVPFLAPLPEFDLERLAASARQVVVAAGDTVVRQGEPGEDWFVVLAGSVEVEVDGVRTGGLLGAGEAFGEIALLRAVPRTATVRATTPTTLFAVSRPAFLAAVTGSADGRRIAEDVAAQHLARDAARAGAPVR